MEFHQRISLEAAAIALFESYARQVNTGHMRDVVNWLDLSVEERITWRQTALDMAREEYQ